MPFSKTQPAAGRRDPITTCHLNAAGPRTADFLPHVLRSPASVSSTLSEAKKHADRQQAGECRLGNSGEFVDNAAGAVRRRVRHDRVQLAAAVLAEAMHGSRPLYRFEFDNKSMTGHFVRLEDGAKSETIARDEAWELYNANRYNRREDLEAAAGAVVEWSAGLSDRDKIRP